MDDAAGDIDSVKVAYQVKDVCVCIAHTVASSTSISVHKLDDDEFDLRSKSSR